MGNNLVYRIKDNFIDLSQIKTFKIAKRYANETDTKRIEITYKDRIAYFDEYRGESKIVSDKLDIVFDDEPTALKALEKLISAWDEYIRTSLH